MPFLRGSSVLRIGVFGDQSSSQASLTHASSLLALVVLTIFTNGCCQDQRAWSFEEDTIRLEEAQQELGRGGADVVDGNMELASFQRKQLTSMQSSDFSWTVLTSTAGFGARSLHCSVAFQNQLFVISGGNASYPVMCGCSSP
eukprot:RCo000312